MVVYHGTIRKKSPNKQNQVTPVKRNETHLSSADSLFLTIYTKSS